MVNRILYTSDLCNCQQDVDTFLFKYTCIAPDPPVPSSKIPNAVWSFIVIYSPQTLLTVEEENIIIYIAGYISGKITKMVCSKCDAGLVGVLNKANSSHGFIATKQDQYIPIGGLVSRSNLMEVCALIEAEFHNNIEKILHMSKVRSRLITSSKESYNVILVNINLLYSCILIPVYTMF